MFPFPSKKNPILEIRDLATEYGRKAVLQGFSLTVYAEEIVALLGPSGCGKTTLLKCIAGLEGITAGEISIFGTRVQAPEFSLPIHKRKLGMIFQDNALFPHLTVYQNVIFGIPAHEARSPETQERIRELLRTLHLDKLSDKYPHEISGGQQQRTSLARSIAPRPKLLLMDEPFTGQDVELKEHIIDTVVRLLQREKITTLVVTHDQNEAFKISSRIGVMREYALDQIGTPKEIYLSSATRFVAGFIGLGAFLEAVITQAGAVNQWFSFTEKSPVITRKQGDKVWVQLRPEDVILSSIRSRQEESVCGVVTRKEFRSGNYLYQVRLSPHFEDRGEPTVFSMMPATFERNLGDQVTVHVVRRDFPFFDNHSQTELWYN